ncbi:glycosyltransferase, partial [bacterium]|nr:glycosyltransferase [bacterium]
MKIAINTLPLLKNKAGAEQYTLNIIKQLAKIDKENIYLIFVTGVNKDIYRVNQENFHLIPACVDPNSKIKRILYEQLVLPFKLKKMGVDVLFTPCNILSLFSPCRNVTMIFDMHWFLEAQKLSFFRLFYVKNFIKWSAKVSDKILTLSENSKKDIIKFAHVESDKIFVVPFGLTPLCEMKDKITNDEIVRVKNKYNIKKKYIMFLGQLLHRKNVDAVIKALFAIKKEKSDLEFDFVVVGGFHEAYPHLKSLAVHLNLEEHVKFLGQLEDEEVGALLAGADLFVYPSLYEG